MDEKYTMKRKRKKYGKEMHEITNLKKKNNNKMEVMKKKKIEKKTGETG